MFPGAFAASTPDKPAIIAAGSGESITFAELEQRSVRVSHVLHDLGLRPGDTVAFLTENTLTAFEIYWGAIRSGLYLTAVNHDLSSAEVAYIVEDSSAKAVLASAGKRELAESVAAQVDAGVHKLAYGGPVTGYSSHEDVLARVASEPMPHQPRGVEMLYSSGTTGRPKGIRPPLPDGQVHEVPDMVGALLQKSFGLTADSRYLSPAPLYHTAPLKWCAAVVAAGGTVVMMERFDAESALATIERHRITQAQFVPTMFIRMLKLPDEVRDRFDVSSLTLAVHAAAPCPVDVKGELTDRYRS